ncbi:MAG: SDR family oxidoreductase [Chloroflexi bacterium]|nr:SDR family oxidoreductase [Chloroflexota bacterium]
MKFKQYSGKIAYITGGSSGIGLACAELLADMGADLVIFARGQQQLETSLVEIERNRVSEKQRFLAVQLDVSQREQAEKLLSKTVVDFGSPDILINSAGISYPQRFEDIPYTKFDEIMRINLNGTWNTVSILLPHMKVRGGFIINVSSVAGYIGVFGMTAYSASKFAVIGFSEALRSELKRFNISVCVLCPPDVDTPMLERAGRIKPEETKAISSSASVMKPLDVARAVIDGMGRGQFLILPGAGTKYTYFMKRLFPGLVESIIDGKIRKATQR